MNYEDYYTINDVERVIDGYTLVRTCFACPQQYDVYKDGKMAAYLRLRHGYFYASVPDVGGMVVYNANTKGDGIFDEDEEDYHLQNAIKAVDEWFTNTNP